MRTSLKIIFFCHIILLCACENKAQKNADANALTKEPERSIALNSTSLLGIASSHLSSENVIKSIKYINTEKIEDDWFELSIDTILNYTIDNTQYSAVIFVNEHFAKEKIERSSSNGKRTWTDEKTSLVGCHSCGPETNCLLMKKQDDSNWIPLNFYKDFKGEGGSWGKSCDFLIRKFGKDKICIGSDWSFYGQGYLEYGQSYVSLDNTNIIAIRKTVNPDGVLEKTEIIQDGKTIKEYNGEFDFYIPDSNSVKNYSNIHVFTKDSKFPIKTIKNNLNVYDELYYSTDSNKYVLR